LPKTCLSYGGIKAKNPYFSPMNRPAFFIAVLLFGCVLFFPEVSLAQGPPPPPQPSPAVPIDGGLGILLAAGAALGAKKAWHSKRQHGGVS